MYLHIAQCVKSSEEDRVARLQHYSKRTAVRTSDARGMSNETYVNKGARSGKRMRGNWQHVASTATSSSPAFSSTQFRALTEHVTAFTALCCVDTINIHAVQYADQ